VETATLENPVKKVEIVVVLLVNVDFDPADSDVIKVVVAALVSVAVKVEALFVEDRPD
jgi:hypothetical protein